ncbi:MAG: GlxA family transcriptional regulator [Rubrivivax sp.]|jgi:transcriptional regulator GlxA family with amidase domain
MMPVRPRRHALVLLPGHSLLAVAAATEALLAANEVLGEARYGVLRLSLDGQPVTAACGTRVDVQGGLAGHGPLAAALVASESLPPKAPAGGAAQDGTTATLSAWLREQVAQGSWLGGLGTGAAWLAEAELLNGYRATVHHAQVAQVSERHPQVVFSSHVYEIDRDRLSCGSGTASLDMTLAWLAREHGNAIVAPLLAHFGLDRLRARDERQRAPLSSRVTNSKVSEAVALMEANLQEPLPTEDIARLVGVSGRQLERLFKQHLDDMPSRHYFELRLARARRLLRHSGQSILQIGLACGFASASHFSKAYRARFGHTPRDERSPRAADWQAHRDTPRPSDGFTDEPPR